MFWRHPQPQSERYGLTNTAFAARRLDVSHRRKGQAEVLKGSNFFILRQISEKK